MCMTTSTHAACLSRAQPQLTSDDHAAHSTWRRSVDMPSRPLKSITVSRDLPTPTIPPIQRGVDLPSCSSANHTRRPFNASCVVTNSAATSLLPPASDCPTLTTHVRPLNATCVVLPSTAQLVPPPTYCLQL
ncbi:unnamed protein product [Camellia sinensis]